MINNTKIVNFEYYKGFINQVKYLYFLKSLKNEIGKSSLTLFHDGLAEHETQKIDIFIESDLKWNQILNVSYSKQEISIEMVFSKIKYIFNKKTWKSKKNVSITPKIINIYFNK